MPDRAGKVTANAVQVVVRYEDPDELGPFTNTVEIRTREDARRLLEQGCIDADTLSVMESWFAGHETRPSPEDVTHAPHPFPPIDALDEEDAVAGGDEDACIGARCLNPHFDHDRSECITVEEAEADHAFGLVRSSLNDAEMIASHLRAAWRAADLGEWSDAAEFLTRAATLSRARDEDLAEVAEFLEQAGFVR